MERMKKCIIPGKRQEHKQLLELLRDVGNVILAYRIFKNMKKWWNDGNALSRKCKELTTWLAWWIIRFSQCGNYIRLVSLFMFSSLSLAVSYFGKVIQDYS